MVFIKVVPDQQFRIYHCVSGRCYFVPDVFQDAVSIQTCFRMLSVSVKVVRDQQFRIYHCVSGRCHSTYLHSLLIHLQRLLHYPTIQCFITYYYLRFRGAATNLHDTAELHGVAAQMNILLENHGTSITVIAGLTMTLKVFALMRRLLNVFIVTPLPFL